MSASTTALLKPLRPLASIWPSRVAFSTFLLPSNTTRLMTLFSRTLTTVLPPLRETFTSENKPVASRLRRASSGDPVAVPVT